MDRKIGLFYGSNDGHTEYIANDIVELIESRLGQEMVEIHNVGRADISTMQAYDYLILGIPTWYIGQLQDDWDIIWDEFESVDLSGKKVAVFGLGDQYGYSDTFLDAAGMVALAVLEEGGSLVGYTDASNYAFEESLFLEGKQFMGLALDEDSQPELTYDRLEAWVPQILAEFGIQAPTAEAG